MDIALHFRVVAYVIENNATYSHIKSAWTISMPHLLAIYMDVASSLSPEDRAEQQLSLQDAVEKGVRDGLWQMDYDEEIDTHVIVLLERE